MGGGAPDAIGRGLIKNQKARETGTVSLLDWTGAKSKRSKEDENTDATRLMTTIQFPTLHKLPASPFFKVQHLGVDIAIRPK